MGFGFFKASIAFAILIDVLVINKDDADIPL